MGASKQSLIVKIMYWINNIKNKDVSSQVQIKRKHNIVPLIVAITQVIRVKITKTKSFSLPRIRLKQKRDKNPKGNLHNARRVTQGLLIKKLLRNSGFLQILQLNSCAIRS